MAIEKWDKLNIPDKLDTIAGWLIMGATEKEVYQNLGVSHSTFNRWKMKHEELSTLLKRTKPIANAAVIASIYKAARGFFYNEIKTETFNGITRETITTKYVPPNPTLAIYYTKNRMPDEWRDRHEIEGNIKIDVELSTTEIRQRFEAAIEEIAEFKKGSNGKQRLLKNV